MHLVVVPPGAAAEPHYHDGYETAIYQLEGRVETRYGEGLERSVVTEAGDFLFVPPGVPHQAVNLSATERAVALIARNDAGEQNASSRTQLLSAQEEALAELVVAGRARTRAVPVRCALPSTSVTTPSGVSSTTRPVNSLPTMLRWRSGSPVASRPSSWSSASRADVPLPHGERSTSPSAKTVTFRWVSGFAPSSCQKITP